MQEINWNRYTYTKEELEVAVKTSNCARQALLLLGVEGKGANYKVINRLIKKLELDNNHWKTAYQLCLKGKNFNKKKELSELLVEGSSITSNSLKKRLIKENKLENKCDICHISTWLGKELVLHLDHINGISTDNRIENLRLLCPNCHSCTATYAGRNIRVRRIRNKKMCKRCNTQITTKATHCKKCTPKKEKAKWPSNQELKQWAQTRTLTSIALELGVSVSAVRKRLTKSK